MSVCCIDRNCLVDEQHLAYLDDDGLESCGDLCCQKRAARSRSKRIEPEWLHDVAMYYYRICGDFKFDKYFLCTLETGRR